MSLAKLRGQFSYDIMDLQGKEIIQLRQELAQLRVRIHRQAISNVC